MGESYEFEDVACKILRIEPDGSYRWEPVTMTEEDRRFLTAAAQRAVTCADDAGDDQ